MSVPTAVEPVAVHGSAGAWDDAGRLAEAVAAFVRQFGLLEARSTPCGVPVSPTHAHAVVEIGRRPGLTQHQLGGELGLARATVSELVADLESRGWVERQVAASDRRQRCLTLTAAGRRIEGQIRESRQTLMAEILGAVEPDRHAAMIDTIAILATVAGQARVASGASSTR